MPVNIVTGAMKYKDTNGDYQDITGVKGATFTPAVSPEGILSWSNDSNLTNPDSVNIKGMVNNSVQIHETVTGPADIVTIQDGADGLPVKDLKVKIEPLQDLHGYDSHWPAGGGKNLFDESTLIHGSFVENPATITQNEKYRSAVLNLPAGTYTFSTTLQNCYVIRICYDNTIIGVANTEQSHTFTSTTDGTVGICFRNTSTTDITESFYTQIEAGSTATAYVPYENICPISGWTEANINVGKNEYNVSTIITGKTLNTTGGIDNSDSQQFITDKIYTNPGDTYTISFTSEYGARTRRVIGFNSNNELVETLYNATWVTVGNKVKSILTIGQDTAYIIFTGYTLDDDIFFGKTPTTYSVSFPSEAGTVYGGELNITTGELKATHVYELIPSNGYSYSSGYDDATATQRFYTSEHNTYNNAPIISDRLKSGNANTTVNTCMVSFLNRIHFRISNDVVGITSNMTTEQRDAALGTWFTNNPTHVCFELSEPIIYHLTPTQITTLLGTNHIWADTGDILSLTYSADPKMYVDQNKGVSDVQINGTSVVTQGVANVPVAFANEFGVVKIDRNFGIDIMPSGGNAGKLCLNLADDVSLKNGLGPNSPIPSAKANSAVFFGMALASGDTSQKSSSNAVGNYTEDAKSKISDMLNAPVTVSGTTPSITALPGVRYICGECSTLSITVPESGIIDVTFTSGSTATVLTVTPPTGMTMYWANGFDPTSLDADTVYEINIMDGCYGVVGTWT